MRVLIVDDERQFRNAPLECVDRGNTVILDVSDIRSIGVWSLASLRRFVEQARLRRRGNSHRRRP